ncbi:hypothetical protein ASF10_19055 [Flavobacterium sp. Leaf82]|jgi:hypothetical protein|uniref:hypothetical protein n=1 Tax=unclassified Flavobacterium TaxID=196869 RepID=UPI0006F81E66|nr:MULTISPECIES: hypothetical protein [unclassified Flavobacterium]KQO33174.1 hypothetical protein ASF10_19055 [Flavobacterium sp. Leaf82]OMQ08818.1 hypothetical protein BXU01_20735 [[Flexibacter] sp. ATCC 35103]
MEIQNNKQATDFFELMNKTKDFRRLKQENKGDNSFSVNLKVSGYNELNMMVSDLLKASIILLNDDAKSLSSITANTDINVMTLLEIALQLLPEQEMELLDDLHKIYLESNAV